MLTDRFEDRTDAGRQLAAKLAHLRGQPIVVLALPRGGLPVGFEVARALGAPLDVLNVRKLGVPWQEELAFGAIAGGGVRVLNDDVIASAGLSTEDIERATAEQEAELERRERLYRGGRPPRALRGQTVVLVDDGIATGATVRAAITVIRAQSPAKLVLAVPVAQATVAAQLRTAVDEMVCVLTPSDLYAIGGWYESFPQLSDDDVKSILARAAPASQENRLRP
jgi:putative phosphoribosyl transferase